MTYRCAAVEPGQRLRYVAEPAHPLHGGGTMEIVLAPVGCRLHWHGRYEVSWRPSALATAALTRLDFEGRFFWMVETKPRAWEKEYHNDWKAADGEMGCGCALSNVI